MERIIQIMLKSLKKRIILLSALCLSLTACSAKPKQYMPYGENNAAKTAFHFDHVEMEPSLSLMADDLSIVDRKKIEKLSNQPSFNAEAVFVSNETKTEIYYAKNSFKKLYPASLTKLMTAYVTLKHVKDFSKEIIVTEEGRKMSDPYAKVMGLMPNDHISIETLLNCILVHSSNDAAKTLAIGISGSEEEFVKIMNQEAMNLGAVFTNFTNSHGLHDKSNYSTLYDLYLIFHALLKDERFVKIIGQKEYQAKYKNGLGGNVNKVLRSTNQYLTGGYKVPSGYTIYGGKTGTTDEAGACMFLSAKSTGGDYYILGMLKASDHLNLYAGLSTIFENIPE